MGRRPLPRARARRHPCRVRRAGAGGAALRRRPRGRRGRRPHRLGPLRSRYRLARAPGSTDVAVRRTHACSHERGGLNLPSPARLVRTGLAPQGQGVPGARVATSAHVARRRERDPCHPRLVLAVRLAADLRSRRRLPDRGQAVVRGVFHAGRARLSGDDRGRRAEVLCAAHPARPHHRRHVPLRPAPELHRRDDLLSFALLVWRCLPFVVLAWAWGGLSQRTCGPRKRACADTPSGRPTRRAHVG